MMMSRRRWVSSLTSSVAKLNLVFGWKLTSADGKGRLPGDKLGVFECFYFNWTIVSITRILSTVQRIEYKELSGLDGLGDFYKLIKRTTIYYIAD